MYGFPGFSGVEPADFHTRSSDPVRVAFVVPMQGPTGIFGPSCQACGELAVEHLNQRSGIGGRPVELVHVDGGREPELVAAEVSELVDSGFVEAIAGWHIIAVQRAILNRVGGRVIYSYPAMHESRDSAPGLFLLGERPVNQLLPAIRWMYESRGLKKWALVGNDYVGPRMSAAVMRGAIAGSAIQLASEQFVPLGTSRFDAVIASLKGSDIDGVVMILMGQDAVHFNRQFARAGLSDTVARLSSTVEENVLLGTGADASRGLYSAAAYFDGLATVEGESLAREYYARWGTFAPALNAIGESCYESIHFLAHLATVCGGISPVESGRMKDGHLYLSPRGIMRLEGNRLNQDVYLAEARGLEFQVEHQISRSA